MADTQRIVVDCGGKSRGPEMAAKETRCETREVYHEGGSGGGGCATGGSWGGWGQGKSWCWLIILFIIIFIIAWIVIVSCKPHWVRNCDANGQHTDQCNGTKALVAALLIAIVIIIILWLLKCLLCC